MSEPSLRVEIDPKDLGFWRWFITLEELHLIKPIQRSLVKGTPPFTIIQLFAFIMCVVVFYKTAPLYIHALYGLALVLTIVILVLHNLYGRKTRSWRIRHGEPNEVPNVRITLMTTLAYLLVGNVFWISYMFALLFTGARLLVLTIVIVGILGAFAISLLGVFRRIFIMVISMTAVCSVGILYGKYGSAAMTQIYYVIVLCAFYLVLTHVQNRKQLESMRMREMNIGLLDVLSQKNQELEQANLAQSRYLSAASHDLRQPLHALALITHDVVRRNEDVDIAPSLLQMEQAIETLSHSFDSMLSLSRLDAGAIVPNKQSMPVQLMFQRLAVEFGVEAQRKGVQLRFVPSRACVMADESLVFTIMGHFIKNAIRYTERGAVVVGVRHGSPMRLAVYDTGVGLSAQQINQMFQVPQRLERAKQRETGGVGLGLAISDRMAKLMSSKIVVHSVLGRGSMFGLTLESAANCPIVAATEKQELNINVLSGVSVALIDNGDFTTEELEQLMLSWGMDVSLILSAEMLEESLQEESFDLVISDIALVEEGQSGLELLRLARAWQSEPAPQCVLMADSEDVTEFHLEDVCEAEGMTVLYKPIRPVRLRSVLTGLMNDIQDES